MFLKQAQSIWEKMGLASMGIAMPQSYAEASLVQIETVFSAESLCQADEELCVCLAQPSVLLLGSLNDLVVAAIHLACLIVPAWKCLRHLFTPIGLYTLPSSTVVISDKYYAKCNAAG